MGEDNLFKKLADELADHKPKDRPIKVARTLKLENEPYVVLRNYCSDKGLTISEVVDKLIKGYVEYLVNTGEMGVDLKDHKAS